MKFATTDVLGVSTGRLLGEIDGIYKVMTFLLGRGVWIHEIAYYSERARVALKTAMPALPGPDDAKDVTGENYQHFLAAQEQKFGGEIDLPDSLADSLADGKDMIKTATEMVGKDRVVAVPPFDEANNTR